MTWMEEIVIDKIQPNECEIKFIINYGLRPDKQKKRNQEFITWLMNTHSLAFKEYRIIHEGMVFRVTLEPSLENWIINKLDELKFLHHFDYNIYCNLQETYDVFM